MIFLKNQTTTDSGWVGDLQWKAGLIARHTPQLAAYVSMLFNLLFDTFSEKAGFCLDDAGCALQFSTA